jgi:hypothetical protein
MMFMGGARPINGGYSREEVPHDGLALAMHESFCDWEDYLGKSEIMIANMYENWIMDTQHSAEQKQAMYEGVLGDAWEKIKSFFRKIGEKIKSWFNAAVKYFQTVFSSNKAFLDKFKDEIEQKDGDKFEYTAHVWNWKLGDEATANSKNVIDIAKKAFIAFAGGKIMRVVGSNKNLEGEDVHSMSGIAKAATEEAKAEKKKIDEAMYKGIGKEGTGGLAKYKTALTKSINGGEPKEIKGMGKKGLTLSEMIDFVENGSDKTSAIKDFADDIKEATDSYSDSVDKFIAANNKGGEDKSDWHKVVNAAADVARYSLSYATAAADVYKSELSTCISECSSILRSFARYSVKESGSGYRQRKGDVSLMEAWTSNW